MFSLQQPYKIDIIIISTSQTRKPRLREVKQVAHRHTASKSRSGIQTQDSLTPRPYCGLYSASHGS